MAYSGGTLTGLTVPEPVFTISMTAMEGDTDALGGSMDKWGNVIGAFLPPGKWVLFTYGFRINGPGVDETERNVCHKMSA